MSRLFPQRHWTHPPRRRPRPVATAVRPCHRALPKGWRVAASWHAAKLKRVRCRVRGRTQREDHHAVRPEGCCIARDLVLRSDARATPPGGTEGRRAGTMKRFVGRRPSPAMVVALIGLFVALGGSSYAAVRTVLPKNSVGSAQVVNHSLLKLDFKTGQLPQGPAGLPVCHPG